MQQFLRKKFLKHFFIYQYVKVLRVMRRLFNIRVIYGPWGGAIYDAPCQIIMHSGQWFLRRRFLKVFAILTYTKLCPLKACPFVTPGTSFEQTLITLPKGCSLSPMNAFRPVVHEMKNFKCLCYINLYSTMSPNGVASCDPRDFI